MVKLAFQMTHPRSALASAVLVGLLVLTTRSAAAAPGDLDPSFGIGGRVTTDFGKDEPDRGHAVAIQPDGKIIIAGQGEDRGDWDVAALARYNPDGSLDTRFDGDGLVTTALEEDSGFNAVAIQPDGKLVAVGFTDDGDDQFTVARYNANGSLEWAVSTQINSDDEDGANAVAIQPDGKIVVAGITDAGVRGANFALARYNADGTLDPTFDSDGVVTTTFVKAYYQVNALAIQADGKIVAAGSASTGNGDVALARYNMDGSLDTTFGTGGRVTTDIGGGDRGEGMAIQADGRIVVAGTSHRQPRSVDFALARYLGGSAAPTATPSVAPAVPTATPTAPSPTATLTVCPGVAGRVPRAALDQAISQPDRVDGWDLICHVSQAPSWWNHLRRSLTLRSNSRLFHLLFNPLVFKCGCG